MMKFDKYLQEMKKEYPKPTEKALYLSKDRLNFYELDDMFNDDLIKHFKLKILGDYQEEIVTRFRYISCTTFTAILDMIEGGDFEFLLEPGTCLDWSNVILYFENYLLHEKQYRRDDDDIKL